MMTGLNPRRTRCGTPAGSCWRVQTTLADMLQRRGWTRRRSSDRRCSRSVSGWTRGSPFTTTRCRSRGQGAGGEARTAGRRGGGPRRRVARGRRSGKPFFLWVHVYDPHLPYDPPSPFREKYKGRPYDGEVAYTDRRIRAAVRRRREEVAAENTLIAVLSDHGESLFRARRVLARSFHLRHDAAHPFPDVWAGRSAGLRVKQQARTIDLLPTVLELMGGRRRTGVQGASLTPAFHGKALPATIRTRRRCSPSSTWAGPNCGASARTAGSTSARPSPNCTTWRRTRAKPPTSSPATPPKCGNWRRS